MWKHLVTGLGVLLVSGAVFVCTSPHRGLAQEEGLGERIGERLDRGLRQLSGELREEWAQIRKSVERMGVQGRVYSRLRWDKHINTEAINIEVRDEDTVVLQGSVASEQAKQKALRLTQDTIGVGTVVDELTVAEAR